MPVAGSVEVLHLEKVGCARGHRRVLDEISLTLGEGEVLGLVGPNGAGKTTLIELVCGLLRADRGRVLVLGRDASAGSRELRRQIGLVTQETALYEEVSGRRNLRFAADLYGVPRPEARVSEVLELIGLTERADDPVSTYSGGMRRRLAIGRALLHRPRLLILDEPTLGVDVEARHQIWMELRGLHRRGASVLLATNYLDEAEALCDEVAVLRQGHLLARDTPEGLIARAGRCIDLEVDANWRESLYGALAREPSVLRVEVTDPGLTISVRGPETPDALVRRAMDVAPLRGFRLRPPDLAEVLRTLEAEGIG
jgi:ABC-2 type transport system ATP-binding protein